jgi:hypothetical protein
MLAIAASRVPGGAPVRFVEADLFTWEPDRQYGLVFMGFWLSHEPADLERQLRALGWDITVTPTAGPFFWGAGSRMAVT